MMSVQDGVPRVGGGAGEPGHDHHGGQGGVLHPCDEKEELRDERRTGTECTVCAEAPVTTVEASPPVLCFMLFGRTKYKIR